VSLLEWVFMWATNSLLFVNVWLQIRHEHAVSDLVGRRSRQCSECFFKIRAVEKTLVHSGHCSLTCLPPPIIPESFPGILRKKLVSLLAIRYIIIDNVLKKSLCDSFERILLVKNVFNLVKIALCNNQT